MSDLPEEIWERRKVHTTFFLSTTEYTSISLTGQLWQQRRKLITPAFHFSILSDFCEVFINNTLTLIDQLRQNPDGTFVNVMTQMKLIALDNICGK